MKQIFFLLAVVVMSASCGTNRQRPDDAVETARQFIRSSLDGDYDWARELLLKDSVNTYELDLLEKKYKQEMSAADKEGFKKAQITVYTIENVSDTVVVINYENTYKKKRMPLKVVKQDDRWQVDLNYTFTGNL